MAARGAVCPAILPADRELLLQATQSPKRTDRLWQIRHASGKALAARDEKRAQKEKKLSATFFTQLTLQRKRG
jgi:hypothetical protein